MCDRSADLKFCKQLSSTDYVHLLIENHINLGFRSHHSRFIIVIQRGILWLRVNLGVRVEACAALSAILSARWNSTEDLRRGYVH